MKQSSNLISTTSLVVIFLIVLGFWGISTVFAANSVGQVTLLGSGINIEATVHAIRLQSREVALDAAFQEQLAGIQKQIEQTQTSLDELSLKEQSQTARQQNQLANLQHQAELKQTLVQGMEANIIQLKQTLIKGDHDYQEQLTALQTEMELTEEALQQRVQQVSAQLKAAQDQLAVLPLAVPLTDNTGLSEAVNQDNQAKTYGDDTSDDKDASDDKYEEVEDNDDDDDDDDDDEDKPDEKHQEDDDKEQEDESDDKKEEDDD